MSTIVDALLGVERNICNASFTHFPRTSAMTSLAFLAEMSAYLRLALNSMNPLSATITARAATADPTRILEALGPAFLLTAPAGA